MAIINANRVQLAQQQQHATAYTSSSSSGVAAKTVKLEAKANIVEILPIIFESNKLFVLTYTCNNTL